MLNTISTFTFNQEYVMNYNHPLHLHKKDKVCLFILRFYLKISEKTEFLQPITTKLFCQCNLVSVMYSIQYCFTNCCAVYFQRQSTLQETGCLTLNIAKSRNNNKFQQKRVVKERNHEDLMKDLFCLCICFNIQNSGNASNHKASKTSRNIRSDSTFGKITSS